MRIDAIGTLRRERGVACCMARASNQCKLQQVAALVSLISSDNNVLAEYQKRGLLQEFGKLTENTFSLFYFAKLVKYSNDCIYQRYQNKCVTKKKKL